MGKKPRTLLFPCVTLLVASTFALSTYASSSYIQKKVSLFVVNTSKKMLCIKDDQGEQCTDHQSAQLEVSPQYFYEREGVIRVSLNHQDLRIAMLKQQVNSASLRIDEAGNIQTEPGTFEKGSFVYSDNKDYLYFVAKPYNLFGTYPV